MQSRLLFDAIAFLVNHTFIQQRLLFLINYYLWHKAKQLKVLAILLEKVKQYNNLLANLKLVAKLNMINFNDSLNQEISNSIPELKNALELTKNSLIKSIELETMIYRDRHLINNRYQLLATLESGLVNLGSLSSNDANEYQKLISEAIAIGLSIHQEVRKTQILRQ